MEDELISLAPPRQVFRVARRDNDPFAPPPWERADPDGTFGNRFDDPSAEWGNAPGHRFRAIYCATTAAGAFGETLARFRPNPRLLAKLRELSDDQTLESQLIGVSDPAHQGVGVVPADWRLGHILAGTELDILLRFVDIAAPQTHQYLRRVLSADIAELDLQDLDLSTVTGPHRRLTQLCARHIHELRDRNDVPSFDGIRYVSRLNPGWECWAIFSDRMRHSPSPSATIHADNPGLMAVCKLFRLSIETIDGLNHFIRP